MKRDLRTATLNHWADRARGVSRFWWSALAGVVLAVAASLFLLFLTRSFASAVRQPAPTVAAPVAQVGAMPSMPNPFNGVALTPQAAVYLGARDTDGDGRVDSLDDAKSSLVLSKILAATDLCAWFVSVDQSFHVTASQTFTAGAVQLASSCASAATKPAVTTTTAPTSAPVSTTATTTRGA